jgi:ADP-L-glycero-D-manno-heptose 6-epimerase
VALRPPGVNGIFNSGSGKARSFADLAASVFRALGKSPRSNMSIRRPRSATSTSTTEAKMERLRAAGYDRPGHRTRGRA